MFNPIFKENIQGGRNIQGVVHLHNENYLGKESPNYSSESDEWP